MDCFKNEEIYSEYVQILEESYSAYKTELFVLSVFPLFAVIEGLMATAFKEYEPDTKPGEKKKNNKLYDNLVDYVESTAEEKLSINLLFFRRVFNFL